MRRDTLIGPPHTYYLTAATSWDQPCFAQREDRQLVIDLIEQLRQTFDLRIYAFAIEARRYHLVLRHQAELSDDDATLLRRWHRGGGSGGDPTALRRRLTSLPGLMQTFAQRTSRVWHRRHGGRGPLWAERYRSCHLADDTALLMAVAWVQSGPGAAAPPAASSRDRMRMIGGSPQLAPLPIRATADGEIYPADETPLDLPPPSPTEADRLFRRFVDTIDGDQLTAYGGALAQGWSLGRPESLAEALARLGRSSGRGRSRRLRELDDDFGLCGVWG